jgi:hypothetical protein
MNKLPVRDTIYRNGHAYSLFSQAKAWKHAANMVAAAHPRSDLIRYFRGQMRLNAVLMIQHVHAIRHITVK